mgnify:CR=1 FL=1|tara:strand:- start:19355 stop:20065 length:711 start_codon:yes stop_codon:yes gene_type:complete
MSKISDFLDKIHDAAPTPLGFGADRSEKSPGLGLFGKISKPTKQKLSALENTVDGIIFLTDPAEQLILEISTPWMVLAPADPDGKYIEELVKKGCDGIQCDLNAKVSAITNDDISIFLSIEGEYDWNKLMVINTLPVDGYVIQSENIEPLSLKQLSMIGSITRSTDKYCLLNIQQVPSDTELDALRKVGVMGLIVNSEELTGTEIKKLKTSLIDMPNPNHKKKQRPQIKSVFEIEE